MKNQTVFSAIITPDGTMLHSTDRHDFKCHTDTKTGRDYCIDGGNDYQKIVGTSKDLQSIIIRIKDPISVVREIVGRGGYGVNGDESFRCCLLMNMSDSWVENSVEYVEGDECMEHLYKQELLYRALNNITVPVSIDEKDSWDELVDFDKVKKLLNV